MATGSEAGAGGASGDGQAGLSKRGLSKRELEVLTLIVAGRSNKEIAAALEISVNTVAAQRANIMDALGLRSAAELVVHVIRHGLRPLP